MSKSIKIAGVGTLSNVGCTKSKTRASSMAKKIREKENRLCRVIKTKSGAYCVFKGRKRKAVKRKKK